MFRMALAFGGYDVKEARDGFTALNLIDQNRPTAIILDLSLPHVSGFIVLAEVTAQAHTRNIPVVVVTALDVGLQDVPNVTCLLHKPIAPDRLVNTVRACIAAGPDPERC